MPSPPLFLQGEPKNFEEFLKRVGLGLFYFLEGGGRLSHKEVMAFFGGWGVGGGLGEGGLRIFN